MLNMHIIKRQYGTKEINKVKIYNSVVIILEWPNTDIFLLKNEQIRVIT